MRDYAFPVIGKMAIDATGTEDVLACPCPIWTAKPETAMRVRGRIEMLLNAAKAEGLRQGDNPALWRGHLDHILPKKPRGGHFAALPYEDAPAFWRSLCKDESMSAQALRFIVLTAARFSMAVPADSAEVDVEKAIWTVPEARMKRGTGTSPSRLRCTGGGRHSGIGQVTVPRRIGTPLRLRSHIAWGVRAHRLTADETPWRSGVC